MATISNTEIERRIGDFKERIKIEPEYCAELFKEATVRLLCHKYAYYVKSCQFIDDYAYDGEETSWYIMGRALGLLEEHDTSPCIDFDENHPLANEAMALFKTLSPKAYF